MTTKEYLEQINSLTVKIEQKRQRAKEYRELALASGGFDYSKERVQTSNLGGQIENRVIRYVALEQEIMDDVDELQDVKDRIIEQIHNLDNADYIKILYKHYVELKCLGVIAGELKISYDWVKHQHGKALQEFSEKNKDDTQKHLLM